MARIHALTRDEAPEEAKAAYDGNLAKYGEVLNSTGIHAYRPMIQAGSHALANGIVASGLVEPKLRFLLNLLVASRVGCTF